MNLFSLLLYGGINIAMVYRYLLGKGRFYQFPFWAGIIGLGWFFPQAVSEYSKASQFPDHAYSDGLFFASLCTAALWFGFHQAVGRQLGRPTWLDASFNLSKLYLAGGALCAFGFYFQWKLASMPEEVLAQTQWSGAAVKYLFLGSVFKFGFLTLWFMYLRQNKIFPAKLMLFIVPCLILLFSTAVLRGRRAAMMNLVSYLIIGLWFSRRIAIPRWGLITGLVFGLILINSIGTYRSIMKDKDVDLSDRIVAAAQADYSAPKEKEEQDTNAEFKNYIFYRKVYAETGMYDFGLIHWNGLIFNYVPAQIVGRGIKNGLMFPLVKVNKLAEEKYQFTFKKGSTTTGYKDAFGSFGWLGFVKFMIIGGMMGVLYRHAMQGSFLGEILYVYMLNMAMHAITHKTQAILISGWIYFFLLGYPALYYAKIKQLASQDS